LLDPNEGAFVNVIVNPAATCSVLPPVTVMLVIVLFDPVKATGPVPPPEIIKEGYVAAPAPVANVLLAEEPSVIESVLPVLEKVRFVVVANDQTTPVPNTVIVQLLTLTVRVFELEDDTRPTVIVCPFASNAPFVMVSTPVAPVVSAEDSTQDPPTPLIVWLPPVLPA